MDATIIVSVVVLGNVVNFWQTFWSQRAIERLRHTVMSTASVLRDPNWQDTAQCRCSRRYCAPARRRPRSGRWEIDSLERFIYSTGCSHGESLPVEKEAAQDEPATDRPEAMHMIFLGTSVVSGSGIAEVTATGPRSVFGGIAARLAVRPEESESNEVCESLASLSRESCSFSFFSDRRKRCATPRPARIAAVCSGFSGRTHS